VDPRLAGYIEALPSRASARSAPPGESTGGLPTALAWRCAAMVTAHLMESGLLLASWAFIGYGALNGRLDTAWLAAWVLCLTGAIPLRLVTRWTEGVVAIGLGGLLKERLMAGAIRMDADVMRSKGAGRLLGEVLESEAIERLGAGGGVESLLAGLELLVVPWVLLWGAAARWEIALIAAWSALTLAWIVANTRRRFGWTKQRLSLTHGLVENMSGYRTRIVQQAPSEWHHEEDRELNEYAAISKRLDRSTSAIEAVLARGYIMAALAVLAPSFLAGAAPLSAQAITLGAILYAAAAFERLAFGLSRAAPAWIAWRTMKPIFDAGGQPGIQGAANCVAPVVKKVLQAQDVVFTHGSRAEPVLKGCSLSVERGDFLLLEGASGSGKSTFAALLAGLRKPESGVILAGGLDRQTLGEETWRRRIAAAPQYHENYILSAPLAFNLLLGRPYPHSEDDMREARELCLELGLGPLLERMPAGLEQMVGETGWQLSQGERCRVFLARALLQRADLVILDESLAALDPENLQQCLETLMRRAGTLLVIAHP
jgi:ATP-binding cassette, subfamily B, bacterial